MRSAFRFVRLLAAPALASVVFACTAAPPLPNGNGTADDGDDDSSRDEGKQESDVTTKRGEREDASTPPAPTTTDAGTDARVDAAPPNGQSCAQLSSCCGQLGDFYDRLACIGVALANDPSVCQPALVVCQGGGVGIGGFFDGESGGSCSELARCCQQMNQRGDSTSRVCEKWVNYADEQECSFSLQEYRQQRRCN